MKIFLLCLVLAAAASAAPFAHFESKTPFTSQVLFAHLDSIGQNASWMEWDSQGLQDKEIAAVTKNAKDVRDAWLLTPQGKPPVFAVLSGRGSGESLAFYRLGKVGESPKPLSVNHELDPERVFRDYRQNGGNFEHLDNPSLKALVTAKGIRFTYTHPDRDALQFPQNYRSLSETQKRSLVRDYRAFFEYEYSVMVRAFQGSVRGLFNWQVWHWYIPAFRGTNFITDKDIEAMLLSGARPAEFKLFFARTQNGEAVEMRTDGNGTYTLEISK